MTKINGIAECRSHQPAHGLMWRFRNKRGTLGADRREQFGIGKREPECTESTHRHTADAPCGAFAANRVMRLDVRDELANEEIAVTYAAIGGVDVEAAFPFGRDQQKIGELSFFTEILDQVPSTAFEYSLLVIAKSVQKVKYWIMTRRMTGSCGVVAGRQHDAIVDAFTEDAALQRVAIDTALRVSLADQKRN